MKTAILLLCSIAYVRAEQALPNHFTGGGVGFQAASSSSKLSGWSAYCIPANDWAWGCAATDFNAGTTSARTDLDVLVYKFTYKSKDACYILGKSGAGAASNLANLGGSFDLGGAIICRPALALKRLPADYLLVFSGSWQKNNVNELFGPNFDLRTFGAQTVWRFGVGKSW